MLVCSSLTSGFEVYFSIRIYRFQRTLFGVWCFTSWKRNQEMWPGTRIYLFLCWKAVSVCLTAKGCRSGALLPSRLPILLSARRWHRDEWMKWMCGVWLWMRYSECSYLHSEAPVVCWGWLTSKELLSYTNTDMWSSNHVRGDGSEIKRNVEGSWKHRCSQIEVLLKWSLWELVLHPALQHMLDDSIMAQKRRDRRTPL